MLITADLSVHCQVADYKCKSHKFIVINNQNGLEFDGFALRQQIEDQQSPIDDPRSTFAYWISNDLFVVPYNIHISLWMTFINIM